MFTISFTLFSLVFDKETDECNSNPCQNDGTCIDLLASYRCDCVPGYTGVHCERGIPPLHLNLIHRNIRTQDNSRRGGGGGETYFLSWVEASEEVMDSFLMIFIHTFLTHVYFWFVIKTNFCSRTTITLPSWGRGIGEDSVRWQEK